MKETLESLQLSLEKAQNAMLEHKGGDDQIVGVVNELRVQLEGQTKSLEEKNSQIEQWKVRIRLLFFSSSI